MCKAKKPKVKTPAAAPPPPPPELTDPARLQINSRRSGIAAGITGLVIRRTGA